MRDLKNPDDLVQVILEIDEPVRQIIGDSNLKETYQNGTVWELLVYLLRYYKDSLYAVVAALDGTITAAEVTAHYTVTEIFRLLQDVMKTDGIREIFSFFGLATRKNGAVSSGQSPENTAE